MKKRQCWLLAGLLLVVGLCTGCSREAMESGQAQGTGTPLSATFEQGVARLAVSDANALSWAKGDAFTLFGVNANSNLLRYRYELSSGAGGNEAVFAPVDDQLELRTVVGVVYPTDYSPFMTPVNAGNPPVGTTLQMTLPHEIDLAEGLCRLPMYAPTTSTASIRFKHLCGLLRVKLSDIPAGYSKLVLKASAPLSGVFTADLTVEEPVLASASTDTEDLEVSFPFPAGQSHRTFYVPLPVGTYATLTAELQGGAGTSPQVLRTWTNLTVRRAVIYTTSLRSVATNATSAAGAAADLAAAFATQTPADGETFQLDLTAQITTSSSDATLSVPQASGSITALTFDAVPNTAAAPLRLETVGETATAPGASANTVVVAIPKSTGGAAAPNMDIHMPTTTVVLAATEGASVTYGNVSALTATNTLVIGRGVKVNQLTVNGGVVHVKAGGAIGGLLRGSAPTVILIVEDDATIPDGLDDRIFIVLRDIRELALQAVAKLGGTFTLTSDMELSRTLVVESDMTLDLGNYRLTPAAEFKGTVDTVDNELFRLQHGAKLTIQGGDEGAIVNEDDNHHSIITGRETAELTIKSGRLSSTSNIISFEAPDGAISIEGGKLVANKDAVFYAGNGTVTISGGEITADNRPVAIYSQGNFQMKGGVLTSNGLPSEYGDVAVVHLVNSGSDKGTAVIEEGTLISKGEASCVKVNNSNKTSLSIAGGSFNDLSCLYDPSYGCYLTDDAKVSITLTRDLEYPWMMVRKGGHIGIDLDGHTLKLTDKTADNILRNISLSNGTVDITNNVMFWEGSMALSDIKMTSNSIILAETETLSIDNSTITAACPLTIEKAYSSTNLKNSYFDGEDYGLNVDCYADVTIDRCQFSGSRQGAIFRAGNITMEKGVVFVLKPTDAVNKRFERWDSPWEVACAAITVGNYKSTYRRYQYPTNIHLKHGEAFVLGTYADSYPTMYVCANPDSDKGVTITYDDYYFGYPPKIEYGTTNITVNGKAVIEQDGQFVLPED